MCSENIENKITMLNYFWACTRLTAGDGGGHQTMTYRHNLTHCLGNYNFTGKQTFFSIYISLDTFMMQWECRVGMTGNVWQVKCVLTVWPCAEKLFQLLN